MTETGVSETGARVATPGAEFGIAVRNEFQWHMLIAVLASNRSGTVNKNTKKVRDHVGGVSRARHS